MNYTWDGTELLDVLFCMSSEELNIFLYYNMRIFFRKKKCNIFIRKTKKKSKTPRDYYES